MKINYVSLGCKVNTYETVAVVNMFVKNGFEVVSLDEESDVTIINTCTVTQTSDSKSRKTIRQIARQNPNSIICVMGCYAQLNSEEASKIDGVSIVVGSSNRKLIYELVMEKINGYTSGTINKCEDYNEITEYEDLTLDHYDTKTRGFVKIQDGCENFCSYCTIPYSRGKFRSRPKDSVIKEINHLTELGMKEIVLTGINTGAYGMDFDDYNFPNLLQDIIKDVKNVGRIRISSIEVTEVTDELIAVIKDNPQHFCNHLHIPLQGGSDEILKKMNRKYDTKYYEEKIRYVKELLPGVNITVDLLVGFNGETDELFKKAYEFVNKVEFGETHIFPYSPRSKTKAYQDSKLIHFADRVDGITMKKRVKELLDLNKINALKYRNKFLGQTVDIIVEEIIDGKCVGHSSNYLLVSFPSINNKPNDLVKVKITKIGYPMCEGVIDVIQ